MQLQRNHIHNILGIKSILPDSIKIQNDLDEVQCVQNSEDKIQQRPGKALLLERSNHVH